MRSNIIGCCFRNSGGSKCVRTTEGEQMAQRIGAVAYVENSALTKEGVRNVSHDES